MKLKVRQYFVFELVTMQIWGCFSLRAGLGSGVLTGSSTCFINTFCFSFISLTLLADVFCSLANCSIEVFRFSNFSLVSFISFSDEEKDSFEQSRSNLIAWSCLVRQRMLLTLLAMEIL